MLLARWLCADPKLLILDEPTRGIDVGAKAEIQALIRELADQGLGVLMISSELEEIVEGADRVFVLSDGRTVADLPHGARPAPRRSWRRWRMRTRRRPGRPPMADAPTICAARALLVRRRRSSSGDYAALTALLVAARLQFPR